MILFLASVPLEPVQWAMSDIFRGKPMIAVPNGAYAAVDWFRANGYAS
ncbi:hypothetical protein [Nevskia soli]|nr:hypothetical protein [Nevskia soli]